MQWKKSRLAGVLGVALTSPWKGGSHAYPMRETVQSAEVPGWADAGGDGEPSRPVSHTGRGGAAARDDDAQAGQDPWHLWGAPVRRGRALQGRGGQRCEIGRASCRER